MKQPRGHHVVAYCDGSCPVTNGPGGWGYVIIDGDEVTEGRGGSPRDETNNTMELTAAIHCLMHLWDLRVEKRPVIVCTDSQYVVNGSSHWRKEWERKGFVKVKNVPLWKELYRELDRFRDCIFVWVRGHNGHYYNERADELAEEGRRKSVEEYRYHG